METVNTHRIQDNKGRWHSVTKSTGVYGAYCEWSRGVPIRLWTPGQFNSKTVEVVR